MVLNYTNTKYKLLGVLDAGQKMMCKGQGHSSIVLELEATGRTERGRCSGLFE